MDYKTIKNLAKENGQSVKDLIVLAPQNDPFYCGSKGELRKGQWFAEQLERFGRMENGKIHVRRLHYAMVGQDEPVLKTNGLPYENTRSDWAYLTNAGKYARYLGLVSPDAFVDRRNPDAHELAPQWSEAPDFYLRTWDDKDITAPEFPELPDYEFSEGRARQDYHVELWVEKSTMDDVLIPLCRKYQVNLVTGLGELSITAVRAFLKRARQQDKPTIILYIADFDPAGYRMSVSVARKIEYFAQSQHKLSVTLQPVVLTQEQVDDYSLPPMPFTNTANARRAANLGAFSDYAVELDALEALHPGVLAEIVSAEIERFIDPKLNAKHRAVFVRMQAQVLTVRDEKLEPFANDWEYLQAHFENATRDFERAIEPIREHLPVLVRDIRDALDDIDLDNSDFPEPLPEYGESYSKPLFSTERDYLEQLEVYRAYDDGEL